MVLGRLHPPTLQLYDTLLWSKRADLLMESERLMENSRLVLFTLMLISALSFWSSDGSKFHKSLFWKNKIQQKTYIPKQQGYKYPYLSIPTLGLKSVPD